MKQTYTIPEARREDIEKLVAKYQKKAAKYNVALTAEYGEPYAQKVPVRKADPATGLIATVDTVLVEVFDLTIDGDEIRKDGYTVVAKIEHLEGGNVVNGFGADVKPAWRTASCNCEHCGTLRDRRLTFIVRHEDGSEKQVGRSCLKDYCGIDPHAIGYRNELEEILISDDIASYDFERRPVQEAYSTVEILALAISTIKRQGYVKSGEPNSNKGEIAEACQRGLLPTRATGGETREIALAEDHGKNHSPHDADTHQKADCGKSLCCHLGSRETVQTHSFRGSGSNLRLIMQGPDNGKP